MPDPNTELMNLAVRAGALAQTMARDRQAEAKMFERARECGDLRGVGQAIFPPPENSRAGGTRQPPAAACNLVGKAL
jgi:hypothetical protein